MTRPDGRRTPRDAIRVRRQLGSDLVEVGESWRLMSKGHKDEDAMAREFRMIVRKADRSGILCFATEEFLAALNELTTGEFPDLAAELTGDLPGLIVFETDGPEIGTPSNRSHPAAIAPVADGEGALGFLLWWEDGGINFIYPYDPPARLLVAALWLIQNPSLMERETRTIILDRAGKAARARGKRSVEADVTVVDLRRSEKAKAAVVAESERTYRHRWIVRGHWHTQCYGPRASLRRKQYVMPYVKGPDGAPLLASEKVYRW